MERAGFAVFKRCLAALNEYSKVLVLAGSGNNGGDGFVTARYLKNAGYRVSVYFINSGSKQSQISKKMYEAAVLAGVDVTEVDTLSVPSMSGFDVIIDALFGVGFNRSLSGVYAEVVKCANEVCGFKLAVDVPTGVNASSGAKPDLCFTADCTVTFSVPKIAHCLNPAKSYCGEVFIEDIGLPPDTISSKLSLLTAGNTPPLPFRKSTAHKGSYGHVLVTGGSVGKTGASVLASLSAMRAGAGLTTCALPGGLFSMLAPFPQLMGLFCGESYYFSEADADIILENYNDSMVLLIGCGIGRKEETRVFIKRLVRETNGAIVLDADGLYGLDEETLYRLKGRAVLTPHIGEFARLVNVDKVKAQEERLKLSLDFSENYGITLMVKSAETVITEPGGAQFISNYGTGALSKGGSGDILAGITAGLIAQKYSIADACKLACYMQAKAAEKAGENRGSYSVNADDIVNYIGYCQCI